MPFTFRLNAAISLQVVIKINCCHVVLNECYQEDSLCPEHRRYRLEINLSLKCYFA